MFAKTQLKHIKDYYKGLGIPCIVCGLGSSLLEFVSYAKKHKIKKDTLCTIGVNDICSIYKPHYLVVTENMRASHINLNNKVHADKVKVIQESDPRVEAVSLAFNVVQNYALEKKINILNLSSFSLITSFKKCSLYQFINWYIK